MDPKMYEALAAEIDKMVKARVTAALASLERRVFALEGAEPAPPQVDVHVPAPVVNIENVQPVERRVPPAHFKFDLDRQGNIVGGRVDPEY